MNLLGSHTRTLECLNSADAGALGRNDSAHPSNRSKTSYPHFDRFGLCDLGLGYPELGHVRLTELVEVRGALRLPVERDLYFRPTKADLGLRRRGACCAPHHGVMDQALTCGAGITGRIERPDYRLTQTSRFPTARDASRRTVICSDTMVDA